MVNIDICSICIHEDFGYCGLRDNKEELEYEHDKDSDLIKCSGFVPDVTIIKRLFKKEKKNLLLYSEKELLKEKR